MSTDNELLQVFRQGKVSVTLFLINGVKLQGFVEEYDVGSIVLIRDNQRQIVYKHAIATVVPSRNPT